jgi:LCP family protein required for cell wall assembly
VTDVTPVRYPDLRSEPLMTKRAWWLVGLNILVPGSAQVLAGNRRAGRFALATTLVFWALVVAAIVVGLIGRTSVLTVLASPVAFWIAAVVLGFYGLVWLVCTLDTLRLVRFGRVGGVARGAVAVLAVVALVATAGTAFGGAWLSGAAAVIAQRVGSNTVDIPGANGGTVTVGPLDKPVNILVVGSDSGDGNAAYGKRGEALNDVTIVLHLSPGSESATAVSIPRDLWTSQPECTRTDGSTAPAIQAGRFNTALSRGGLGCVATAVTALTGLDIQYAAKIEFDGVVAMSNAVGGVTVCLATPIDDKYTGLHLPAGENTLQGQDALSFLRTRHGLSTGSDLQRISNQQVFLSALMRKVKDSATLGNPVELVNLASAAADHMQLSTSLAQTSTMVSLALTLKQIPLERIVFAQYPSTPKTVNRQAVTVPDTEAASALMDALAQDKAVVVGGLGNGAVAGSGGTTPTATPTPTAGKTPPAAPVTLPPSVSGQPASQQTCSAGKG